MFQLFIICAIFFIKDALTQECEAENQYPWSYHGTENGPYDWPKTYPDCGGGDQSPIEFSMRDVTDLDWPKLKYDGFDSPITEATVQNVGWTVLVIPGDGINRTITWGDVPFTLQGIHFHFGDPGSENIVDNMDYEMEIHYVVQQNNKPDQLAVVAARMEANNDKNDALGTIVEVLPNVQFRDDSTELQSDLNLADLLPQDSGSYYYYEGSNGIPPCQAGIIWWVLKDVGKIGDDDLSAFLALYSVGQDDASDSCLMGPNTRPPQNVDHRAIIGSE